MLPSDRHNETGGANPFLVFTRKIYFTFSNTCPAEYWKEVDLICKN
jgi:hypothetical protein